MAKPSDAAGDSSRRRIPSVDRILASEPFAETIRSFGRSRVKEALSAHLEELRSGPAEYDERIASAAVQVILARRTGSTLRPVVNGSGIIIHTNLGRSPVDEGLWARAGAIAASYSNLEFDLQAGQRGARDEHLSSLCSTLFGCQAAVLTNNNASAILLLLSALARDREVIVSRGELVEIGGSFRVPDVIQQGGARLREVGTTNRTRASDYAEAVGPDSSAILRVHRSNFEIVGFTETPSISDLVNVSREQKVFMLYDEGSGRVVDLSRYGFAPAPTIREVFLQGVDALTCSTDKLIGATQGGLILGSSEIIARCRRHPLMRALRAGKESYAVIAETLRAFATEAYETEVPVYRMLATPLDALRRRAERLVEGTAAVVIDSRCALGGGTTPAETIPSIAIALPGNANELAARMLAHHPPVVGRILEDRFTIDMRTLVSEGDVSVVAAAIR